ncbi:polyprenyl synthetase family protein [Ornithinimicrobium sp. F0845]|uniref:polyprenyl synthetase family protein n=1 Tax=Ornithinimicrobium sp. F0845 TaxID=2926412 RepID=UPI001FF4F732|nr:polyprenyl synthetase family protein [Ornithinimicrobium sp. F0845]MCK0113091.1 polyprenyl synthetase family protein [Ornithinimicrobium sp. F0845]
MTTTTAPTGPPDTGLGLERFLMDGQDRVVDEHDQVLWQALRAQTEGGKRFRPALLIRLHDALGGYDHRAAAAVADAIELLHTAFVIHDDVIDADEVRRGRPNVGGIFSARARAAGAGSDRARRYGETAGILAGDLALAGAVRTVALCGARPDVVVRLLDLLEEVLHRSAAGELADVRASLTADASLADTLDIAEWKTAAYSFELPLQAAAVLADAPDEVVAALGAVGRSMGVAFQLQDDLDGTFGRARQTGKDPLGDLREGKGTALVTIARSTRSWAELSRYVGDSALTAEGAERARELLVACGARRAVEALVQDLRDAALTAAAGLPVPARAALQEMVALTLPGTAEPSTPGRTPDGETVRGAA